MDQQGSWVSVALPGGFVRQDWVPTAQPPSPDGTPGTWHVVTADGSNRWEWHARPAPAMPTTGPPAGAWAQRPAPFPIDPKPPTPTSRKPWAWIVGGVVAFILIGAIASAGDEDATAEQATSGTFETAPQRPAPDIDSQTGDSAVAPAADGPQSAGSARAASCAGLTYPDQQPRDTCASNGTVEVNGLRVTAQPLVATLTDYNSRIICSAVSLVNVSQGSLNYYAGDFKVQSPSGDVQDWSGGGTDLDSGVLIAGGQRSGRICTEDKNERGPFVFIYKPDFKPDRGIWLFDVR